MRQSCWHEHSRRCFIPAIPLTDSPHRSYPLLQRLRDPQGKADFPVKPTNSPTNLPFAHSPSDAQNIIPRLHPTRISLPSREPRPAAPSWLRGPDISASGTPRDGPREQGRMEQVRDELAACLACRTSRC